MISNAAINRMGETMPVGCGVLGHVADVEVVEVTFYKFMDLWKYVKETQGLVDEPVQNRPIGKV